MGLLLVCSMMTFQSCNKNELDQVKKDVTEAKALTQELQTAVDNLKKADQELTVLINNVDKKVGDKADKAELEKIQKELQAKIAELEKAVEQSKTDAAAAKVEAAKAVSEVQKVASDLKALEEDLGKVEKTAEGAQAAADAAQKAADAAQAAVDNLRTALGELAARITSVSVVPQIALELIDVAFESQKSSMLKVKVQVQPAAAAKRLTADNFKVWCKEGVTRSTTAPVDSTFDVQSIKVEENGVVALSAVVEPKFYNWTDEIGYYFSVIVNENGDLGEYSVASPFTKAIEVGETIDLTYPEFWFWKVTEPGTGKAAYYQVDEESPIITKIVESSSITSSYSDKTFQNVTLACMLGLDTFVEAKDIKDYCGIDIKVSGNKAEIMAASTAEMKKAFNFKADETNIFNSALTGKTGVDYSTLENQYIAYGISVKINGKSLFDGAFCQMIIGKPVKINRVLDPIYVKYNPLNVRNGGSWSNPSIYSKISYEEGSTSEAISDWKEAYKLGATTRGVLPDDTKEIVIYEDDFGDLDTPEYKEIYVKDIYLEPRNILDTGKIVYQKATSTIIKEDTGYSFVFPVDIYVQKIPFESFTYTRTLENATKSQTQSTIVKINNVLSSMLKENKETLLNGLDVAMADTSAFELVKGYHLISASINNQDLAASNVNFDLQYNYDSKTKKYIFTDKSYVEIPADFEIGETGNRLVIEFATLGIRYQLDLSFDAVGGKYAIHTYPSVVDNKVRVLGSLVGGIYTINNADIKTYIYLDSALEQEDLDIVKMNLSSKQAVLPTSVKKGNFKLEALTEQDTTTYVLQNECPIVWDNVQQNTVDITAELINTNTEESMSDKVTLTISTPDAVTFESAGKVDTLFIAQTDMVFNLGDSLVVYGLNEKGEFDKDNNIIGLDGAGHYFKDGFDYKCSLTIDDPILKVNDVVEPLQGRVTLDKNNLKLTCNFGSTKAVYEVTVSYTLKSNFLSNKNGIKKTAVLTFTPKEQ